MIMGTGMAWDLAYGCLCDFNGNGKYTATGNMTQGVGAEGSIGILFSYGGNDSFASRSAGSAPGSVTYHPPACGGNFSFLINYGGENAYLGAKAPRHSYLQRGTPSGFLSDRPTEAEAVTVGDKLRQQIEDRNREIREYDELVARRQQAIKDRLPPSQIPRITTQRPRQIPESQLIGAVPDFDVDIRRAEAETIIK
jgi:hypothetical protein